MDFNLVYVNTPPNAGHGDSPLKEIHVKQAGKHCFDSVKPMRNVKKEPGKALENWRHHLLPSSKGVQSPSLG